MLTNIAIAFFVYFCVLLCIGLASYRKQKSSADFIVGGRSLNFWVIALSAHASDMSSWLFMAFPAAIYIKGFSQIWMAVGLLLGMFLAWQFIAKKLRTSTEQLDSYTLPSFFEKRFKDSSGVIRVVTALISVVFLTCYLAAGLLSMGLLLESIFGIDYYIGLTLATLVVVIYTFAGGFITVVWTDLFQALFLLLVIVVVPVIAFSTLPNGLETIRESAANQNIDLTFFGLPSADSFISILFLVFGWGIGYFGQPHIVTKFMGIRDANELKKSKYVGMAWMVASLSAAVAVGVVSIAYFQSPLDKPELIFIEMIKTLFHPFVGGIFLCGIIAATMSTMDSQILVCASVLSEDFYKHIVKRKAGETELLLVAKSAVILVSLISLLIAFNKSASILDSIQYAWAGLGSAFGPLLLMSLYSKKTNREGAIAGIVVGGFVAAVWDSINPYIIDYPVPSMIPAFSLSLLAIYAVSLAYRGNYKTRSAYEA